MLSPPARPCCWWRTNAISRTKSAQALQGEGHPVEHAQTLEQGLAAARRGVAAVLIVDRMLTGEDGLSLVETLRGRATSFPCC